MVVFAPWKSSRPTKIWIIKWFRMKWRWVRSSTTSVSLTQLTKQNTLNLPSRMVKRDKYHILLMSLLLKVNSLNTSLRKVECLYQCSGTTPSSSWKASNTCTHEVLFIETSSAKISFSTRTTTSKSLTLASVAQYMERTNQDFLPITLVLQGTQHPKSRCYNPTLQ